MTQRKECRCSSTFALWARIFSSVVVCLRDLTAVGSGRKRRNARTKSLFVNRLPPHSLRFNEEPLELEGDRDIVVCMCYALRWGIEEEKRREGKWKETRRGEGIVGKCLGIRFEATARACFISWRQLEHILTAEPASPWCFSISIERHRLMEAAQRYWTRRKRETYTLSLSLSLARSSFKRTCTVIESF